MEKLNYFSCVKFLKKYILKYRKNFVMFYLGWLFDSILALLIPIIFGILIDEVVYYQNLRTFFCLTSFLIISCFFSCGLYFLLYSQHGYLMNMFGFEIKKDVFSKLQKCKASYLDKANVGNIMAELQDYPEECMHFIVRNMIHITNESIFIILYGIYLWMIDWHIGLIAILTVPLSTFVNFRFKKKIRIFGETRTQYYQKYLSWLLERLKGINDINWLGAEEKAENDFEECQGKVLDITKESDVSTVKAQNFVKLINLIIQLSIYGISAFLVANGEITVGVLTVILSFYDKLTKNVNIVSSRLLDSEKRISYIQRIYDFLQLPTEDEWAGKEDIIINKGSIKFHDISFSYENRKTVLQHINLQINSGERVALLGKSGSGKSTLAYLLIGFYQPTKGKVEIDGQALASCNLKSIRQEVGFVQQNVLIFSGTIRQNLLLGKHNASEQEIRDACKIAGIWEFVQSLPQKLDTLVGREGIDVSGGQKQRIAIARIYLKDPKILIFDEATSALDEKTEKEIIKSWKKVFSDRTSIVITHRQETALACDKAIIIENGEIVESGNVSDINIKGSKFQELFTVQEG